MSQPLSNLAEGSLVNIVETINGVQHTVPMLIIANNINNTNPYGSDVTFCIRYRVTGAAGTGTSQDTTVRYGQSAYAIEYEGSVLDNYMCNEWLNRLDTGTQASISTSTIVCYNLTNDSTYTLARKAFAPSSKEVGFKNTKDASVDPGYFTNNDMRIAYDYTGTTRKYWWLRTPYTATIAYYIYIAGSAHNSSNVYSARPARPACNFYSTTLVSDEPNEDGSYDLLPGEAGEKRLSFDCLLGETESRVSQAHIDIAFECSDENMEMSTHLCNNYNDASPTWELYENGSTHVFQNRSKTADSWALGLKVYAHGENTIRVYEPAAMVTTD